MKLLTKTEDTTIGCDPEVFFLNKEGDIHSASGLIGGDKSSPLRCRCGALQEDNVMGEFNIDPVTNLKDWIENIKVVYSQLEGIAIINECSLGIIASKNITQLVVMSDHKAGEFGCDPDFNAYTGKINPTPDVKSLLRTCAGHIHIGYDIEEGHSLKHSATMAKYMDAYVGTFCVINDEDTRRMTRYGKAGAFRPKPYGTEYRVPSNFWLKSDHLKEEIFKRTREAYRAAKGGYSIPSDVILAINTQNKVRCEEILRCLQR